jgi:Clp protease
MQRQTQVTAAGCQTPCCCSFTGETAAWQHAVLVPEGITAGVLVSEGLDSLPHHPQPASSAGVQGMYTSSAGLPLLDEVIKRTDAAAPGPGLRDVYTPPSNIPLLDTNGGIVARTGGGGAAVANPTSRGTGGRRKPQTPPPDLPSLLLHGRIVFVGMPLVAAVTELVISELLWLQYMDQRKPIHMYINSTGTTRADGETVAFETEGTAIYDAMRMLRNPVRARTDRLLGCRSADVN